MVQSPPGEPQDCNDCRQENESSDPVGHGVPRNQAARAVRSSQTYLAEPDADGDEVRSLRPLQAAAVTYRITFGPRAGQKMLTLRGAMPREGTAGQPLCVDIDGFSLHVAVRVGAHDRKRLEQLCRIETAQARFSRIGWARLLNRVFDIDMQHCPNCGVGELRIIAAILERPVIGKILTHLGLDPQPPPKGRAREAGHDVAA
jgi:hypothetical protein